MTICCVIPVYNAEKYLEETLTSIFLQTRLPDEIIAVNDGSTDSSVSILSKYKDKITIINRPHEGVTATLNAGIKVSKADIITFLDSDDLWRFDKTEIQFNFLEQTPEAAAVFGTVKQFVSEECDENEFKYIEFAKGFSRISLMIRREAFIKVGFFDESLKKGEFIEWFSRFKFLNIKHHITDDIIAYRRLRKGSLSSNKENDTDFSRIMKKHLDNKRNLSM